MEDMTVTVAMTTDDFLEFVAWGERPGLLQKQAGQGTEQTGNTGKENVLGHRRRSEEARQGQNH